MTKKDPAWIDYHKRALIVTRKTAPPFDEWVALMETMNQINQSHSFWIGDLYNAGEHFYGDMRATSIMDNTDWNLKTLQNAAWVCGKIEPERRRDELSFSHHAEISALDPADQDKYLQLAIDNLLSVRKLRDLIRSDQDLDDVMFRTRALNERCETLRRKVDSLVDDVNKDLPMLGTDAAAHLINARDELVAAKETLDAVYRKQGKKAA